jgi:DNA-binding transcriptional ArsR family regulator
MTLRRETIAMRELEQYFKALADSTRLRILNLLLQGELWVCDVQNVPDGDDLRDAGRAGPQRPSRSLCRNVDADFHHATQGIASLYLQLHWQSDGRGLPGARRR